MYRVASGVIFLQKTTEKEDLVMQKRGEFREQEEGFDSTDDEFSAVGCWEWSDAERQILCTPEYCDAVAKTTLYCECCPGPGPIGSNSKAGKDNTFVLRPLLITGTPRSGTVFLSTLLTSLGLHMATDTGMPTRSGGMVSWVHLYKDYQDDLKFFTHPLFNKVPAHFAHVLQLVRDPLASLTSIAFTEPILTHTGYLRFVSRHVPMQDVTTIFPKVAANTTLSDSPQMHELRIRRALEFYTGWHQAIAALNVPLLRLEDVDEVTIGSIFTLLGRSPPDADLVEQKMELGLNKQENRRRLMPQRTEYRRANLTCSSPSREQHRRRLLPVSRGEKRQRRDRRQHHRHRKRQRHKKGAVRTNRRSHRTLLTWTELCQVDAKLTDNFLDLAQSFGYYEHIRADSVCDSP